MLKVGRWQTAINAATGERITFKEESDRVLLDIRYGYPIAEKVIHIAPGFVLVKNNQVGVWLANLRGHMYSTRRWLGYTPKGGHPRSRYSYGVCARQ